MLSIKFPRIEFLLIFQLHYTNIEWFFFSIQDGDFGGFKVRIAIAVNKLIPKLKGKSPGGLQEGKSIPGWQVLKD